MLSSLWAAYGAPRSTKPGGPQVAYPLPLTPSPPLCASHCLCSPDLLGSGGIFHTSPTSSSAFPYDLPRRDRMENHVWVFCVCVSCGADFGERSSVVFSDDTLVLSTDFIVLVLQRPELRHILWVIKWRLAKVCFVTRFISQTGSERASWSLPCSPNSPRPSLASKRDFTSPSTASEALFAYDNLCQMSSVLQNPKWEWLGHNQSSLTGKS